MRRTLYLSMVCLLSALSVVGQTGSRDLNPIEKQKLQSQKELQKMKDAAAMEREKLKAKTAIRNKVVGEK